MENNCTSVKGGEINHFNTIARGIESTAALKYTVLFDKDTKYIVTKYTLHYTTIL